jgi:hypothetical protein
MIMMIYDLSSGQNTSTGSKQAEPPHCSTIDSFMEAFSDPCPYI